MYPPILLAGIWLLLSTTLALPTATLKIPVDRSLDDSGKLFRRGNDRPRYNTRSSSRRESQSDSQPQMPPQRKHSYPTRSQGPLEANSAAQPAPLPPPRQADSNRPNTNPPGTRPKSLPSTSRQTTSASSSNRKTLGAASPPQPSNKPTQKEDDSDTASYLISPKTWPQTDDHDLAGLSDTHFSKWNIH